MSHTRDHVTIRGQQVLHSTAQRDWVCGICLSGLVTKWFDDDPHWRTICKSDESHSPDGFIHKHTIPYLEHKVTADKLIADDVFAHLPEDFQEEIERS
jgi:transcription initiation factor TFIIIB Brf1 subunit/transcription initiation factor TFIIB